MSTLANVFLRFLAEENHDDHDDHDMEHHDDVFVQQELDGDDGKPWKEVFLATLLINLTSLSGVVLVAFSILGNRLRNGRASVNFTQRLDRLLIPSFAAGALLATSVFLIIPESIELIAGGHSDGEEGHNHLRRYLQDDHGHGHDHDDHGMSHEEAANEHDDHGDNHSEVAWKFGVALMAGYLLPFLIGSLFPHPHLPGDICEECVEHESLMGQSKAVHSVLHEKEAEHCCNDAQNCNVKKDRATASTASVTTMDVTHEVDVDEMIHKRNEAVEEEKDSEDTPTPADEGASFTLKEVTGWSVVEEEKASELETHEEDCCSNMECVNNHDVATSIPLDYQLIGSIILGDGFHNFTDGLFVGNAFLFCDRRFAYAVASSTIYHELAQEFSDFCLLTRHCGLSVVKALAINFLSGFSVMIGAFVILSVDLTTEAMGIILALSAGVYLYIAGAECIARIQQHDENKTVKNRLIFVFCFALGSIPIGLVLRNHSHGCE